MVLEGLTENPGPLLVVDPEPNTVQRPQLLPNVDEDPSIEDMPQPSNSLGNVPALHSQHITPMVEPGEVISVGHEFTSAEDALKWYNNYAKKASFSTKVTSNRKNRAGLVCWKSFACSKEGKTNDAHRKKHKEAFG